MKLVFASLSLLCFLLPTVVSDAPKLPSLDDVIKTVKTTAKFTLGKCELSAKKEGGIITIEVAAEKCRINLKEIVDHFYPSNKLAEETKNFLVVEMLFLKVVIDTEKKTIEFNAKSPGKIDIIKDKLAISDSMVMIKLNLQKAVNYENIEVKMSGKISIGKQDIDIEIVKKEGAKKMTLKVTTKNVAIKLSVKDVVSLIGAKELFSVETLEKKIVDFTLESISIEGGFDPTSSNLELSISGIVKDQPLAKLIKFHVVIVKTEGEPYKVGLVGKIKSVDLMKLVEFILGKKVEAQFLKDKTLDAILLAGSKDIMLIENKDALELIKEVPKKENAAIPKGLTVTFKLSVEKQKDDSKDSKDKADEVQVFMRLSDKKFQFKFIPNLEMQFQKAVESFDKDALNFELPKWLGKIDFNIKFKKFSFDLDGSISLKIFAPGQVTLGSILRINDIRFEISRKAEWSVWDFSLESDTLIAKEIVLSISVKKENGNYQLTGKIGKISMKELLKYIVSDAKFASGEFEKFNLALQDVVLDWKLPDESKPSPLSVSATAKISDWEDVKVEVIFVNVDGKTQYKVGIFVPKLELCEMVKTYFGKEVDHGCWLKEVDYMLSMDDVNGKVEYGLAPLKGMPKEHKGFYFKVKATFPENCDKFKLCEEGKHLINKMSSKRDKKEDKNAVIYLEGVVKDKHTFRISAKLKIEEKKSETVTLTGYEFVIAVEGHQAALFYGVNVRYHKGEDHLDIKGRIGISTDGDLSLSGSLDGEWKKPFGLNNIVIRSLVLSVSINVAVPIPSLQFGAKLTIGRPESEKKIEATIELFISVTNPSDVYYYAQINKMTVEDILDLFGLTTPKILKGVGFPNGYTVAFTLNKEGKQLATIDKKIDSGLTIIGDLDIFGFFLSCRINIDPNVPHFLFHVQMKAIKLKLISFTKIDGKDDEGPEFRVEIGKSNFDVKINAKVTVLGVSAGATITVTEKEYSFKIEGRMFDVFKAELHCRAAYGDLKSAEFSVGAKLTFGKELEDEIKEQVEETKEKTEGIMEETEKTLRQIESMGATQKASEERFKDRLKEVQEEIAKDVSDVKELAKIKECASKCNKVNLGGVIWKENCIQVAEVKGKKQYVGCPEWKDDLYSYPDLGCIAECKGDGFLSVLWSDTKQIAARVSDSVAESLDSVINFFKDIWEKVTELVDFAKKVYEDVKNLVKTGIDMIASAIDKLISLVGVTEVSFDTSLKAAEGAEIELGVKIKSTVVKFKASLKGNLLKRIAEVVIEHIHKGYDKLKEGFTKAKGYLHDVAAKLGIVEKELAKAQEKKENKNANKRSYVPTADQMEIKRILYDPLPRPLLNDFATVQAFEDFTPSEFMSKHTTVPKEKIPRLEDTSPARRETINELMHTDPCTQLGHVVKGYTHIADNLRKLKDAYIAQEKAFRKSAAAKRNRIKKIAASLKRKCVKTPGCNKKQLQNILHYARKARDATTDWVKAVRSKIIHQNKESFDIWRRNMDNIYKSTKGLSIRDYAKEMYSTATSRADTRERIPHHVSSNLSDIAKHVDTLFDREQFLTIKEAYPTIQRLNKDVKSLVKESSKFKDCTMN